MQTNVWNWQGVTGLFSQHKGTALTQGKYKHPVDNPSAIKKFFAWKNGWRQCVPQVVYKHGESDQGEKLRSHFPRGGPIGAIAGIRSETKIYLRNNIYGSGG